MHSLAATCFLGPILDILFYTNLIEQESSLKSEESHIWDGSQCVEWFTELSPTG